MRKKEYIKKQNVIYMYRLHEKKILMKLTLDAMT